MRMAHNWVLVGRLAPGVSMQAVQRQLDVVSRRLQQAYPATNGTKGLRIDPLQGTLLAEQTPRLVILLAAVGLVLLIACANVAGMLLTRGVARTPELAVRAALGASRGRIAAQLVTESMILSVAAGGAGIVLATWLGPLLAVATGLSAAGVEVRFEWSTLLFALAAGVATGVVCGVTPAWRVSSLGLAAHLAPGARATGARGGARARSVLVAAQVALSFVLLVGAGLVARSLVALTTTDLKFRTEHLLAAALDMPAGTEQQRLLFQSVLKEDLAAIPGVSEVTFTSHMPVLEPWEDPPVWPADGPPPDPSRRRSAFKRTVMPGFFDTLGIRLLAGRDFSTEDRPGTPRVMVVNDTFARTFFHGEDAVGQRVMMGHPEHPLDYLIVGVVESVRTDGALAQPSSTAYLPATQAPLQRARALLRTTLAPEDITRAVRKAVAARNPDLVVRPAVRVETLISDSLLSQRTTTAVLTAFSVLALLLAALGLYGVLAHHVAQRSQEIGVRMALGASVGRIVAGVLRRSMLMVLPGLVVGVLAALAGTKLIGGLLHGVSPADPLTFAGVTGMIAMVALAASAWPAWRAAGVDPVRALRGE